MYTTQAYITHRPFSASNPKKKGCSDVQHASKTDQNIVTHEEYVTMLIIGNGGTLSKGHNHFATKSVFMATCQKAVLDRL